MAPAHQGSDHAPVFITLQPGVLTPLVGTSSCDDSPSFAAPSPPPPPLASSVTLAGAGRQARLDGFFVPAGAGAGSSGVSCASGDQGIGAPAKFSSLGQVFCPPGVGGGQNIDPRMSRPHPSAGAEESKYSYRSGGGGVKRKNVGGGGGAGGGSKARSGAAGDAASIMSFFKPRYGGKISRKGEGVYK